MILKKGQDVHDAKTLLLRCDDFWIFINWCHLVTKLFVSAERTRCPAKQMADADLDLLELAKKRKSVWLFRGNVCI